MASYTVAEDEVSAPDKTLVASTTDTVTFQPDVDLFEVLTDGAAEIRVTIDGTDPGAALGSGGGSKCYVLPALPGVRTIRHWRTGGVVKLWSSGTPTYTLTRA